MATASRDLSDWLQHLGSCHPKEIEFGLDRVARVYVRLDITPLTYTVITIAGTNGKGSSAVMLDAILSGAGYSTGRYTSPHLAHYNERVCVGGRPVSDQVLCEAFDRVEQARGAVALTYFEFGTLAALVIFSQQDLDAAILEVGMGGRLDAVNLVDADVALITSIDQDHLEWLGPDRESIGREKAGILRRGQLAVCSDPAPPSSLARAAKELELPLCQLGTDYFYRRNGDRWTWTGPSAQTIELPVPTLDGPQQLQNAAGVVAVLDGLRGRFPLTPTQLGNGLVRAWLAGRFECLPGPPQIVLDVAHNLSAVQSLKAGLSRHQGTARTLAVFAALSDKPVSDMARCLASDVDAWYLAGLNLERGCSAKAMEGRVLEAGVTGPIKVFPDPKSAFEAAFDNARKDDRIVVFGSFYTVSDIMQLIEHDLNHTL